MEDMTFQDLPTFFETSPDFGNKWQSMILEISDKAKSWSWWQVTAYITQELRESVRFLERIYTYDELRLHSMILGLQVCRNLDDDFAVAVQTFETYPCISLQTAYIWRIWNQETFAKVTEQTDPNGCWVCIFSDVESRSFPRKADSKRWFTPWHGCKSCWCQHALRNPKKIKEARVNCKDRKALQHCC